MNSSRDLILIVIGVSGVGKTTVAKLLAKELQLDFADADDFHPAENISKMSQGHSLDDEDRGPWLSILNQMFRDLPAAKGTVLACSALKESYRQQLVLGLKSEVHWVILNGDADLIEDRMRERNHFMPPELLKSQFETWEEPEYGIKVDVSKSPTEIVDLVVEKINMKEKSEIGLIGLGVMGKSLARNIAGRGFGISVYNRHVDGKEEKVAECFVEDYEEMSAAQAFDDLSAFANSLSSPRKIFLMVNAGSAVDAVINDLTPFLENGDLIIDGGNSHYKDSERRFKDLASQGLQFIGTGVSGGEEGALKGPSIMPGGSKEAYELVESIFTSIAAKDAAGSNCCAYIGNGGAGHFVKMVHNGIEYGEMQLIAEVYGLLRHHMKFDHEQISNLFKEWNASECSSYLLEITADILTKKEGENYLIDLILDRAGNKGTGGWTTVAATELGVAIPTLTAALYARYQSAQIDLRQAADKIYPANKESLSIGIKDLKVAYQMARIINHHQGYDLIFTASEEYGWDINFKDLSRIWTNGCIIRSKLMEQLSESDFSEPQILMQEPIRAYVNSNRGKFQEVISRLAASAISAPCFLSSLSYLNGYVESKSLANVIQAQRDYFGAHTYERVDANRGDKFHTNWI